MHSDQTRKYGISESIIQALYKDIVGNKVIINKGLYYVFRDAILSRLVTMHQAPGASCDILYYPGLVSCPFYAIPIYPF